MNYKTLAVDFELDSQNYYIIKQIEVRHNTKCFTSLLDASIFECEEDTMYYVNDLDKLYIYLIDYLIKRGNINNVDKLKPNTFTYVYKGGKCANVKYMNDKGVQILFINFKLKFGIPFGSAEDNQELIDYAIQKGRVAHSLGADAYNEFITTIFNEHKYMNYVAHQNMRKENHYPIFEYQPELLEAKENVAGYQMCKQGNYEGLIEYDINSSYPSQLLCNTPKGKPTIYLRLEDVPKTYFKVITFTYFNCKVKPNKIEFIHTTSMGELSLTQNMFDLFIENYNANIKIKKIIAFKTEKSPYRKFITDNIINGKLKEKRAHIAQYNKFIGNAIIGYMGRNTTTTESMAKLSDLGIETTSVNKSIDPIYLPVYLCVLDKAKSAFIRTIQKHQKTIVYANTDGFLSTQPIDTNILNIGNTLPIGNYRQKNMYVKIHIECINGYAGILDTGEIDNTISGMTLETVLTPDEYQDRKFTYYVNVPDKSGRIRKDTLTPHQ